MGKISYTLNLTIQRIINAHFSVLLWLTIAIILRYLTSFITLFSLALIVIKDIANKRKVFRIELTFVLLLLSVSLYAWNGMTTGLVTPHNCLWIFTLSLLSYTVGKGLVYKFRTPIELFFLFFFLFFILALPNIPITLYDILQNGLVNPERNLGVLSDSDVQRHTTGRTVELSLAIAGIFMVFNKPVAPLHRRIRMNFVVLALIAELCTLHYVSRTGLFIFGISLFFGFLYNAKVSKKATMALVLSFVILYFFKDSSLGAVFADREVEGSTISDAGGRTDRWLIGITMLFANPQGYIYNDGEWYAHNFWLDFGREGGLYAFVALVSFSLTVLWKSFRLQKQSTMPNYIKKTISFYSIIFLLTLFAEAIHTGAPLFMYVYYMIAGITVELCHNDNLKRRSIR